MTTFLPDVYISLTSIPKRIGTEACKRTLTALISQDYPRLKGIYLTLPLENMRGQVWSDSLPDYLTQEPFASKITILRPQKDYGPIMKWIRPADVLPRDAYMFVCDDDELYIASSVSNSVKELDGIPAEQRLKTIVNAGQGEVVADLWLRTSIILGVTGALSHSSFIRLVNKQFDRTTCRECLHIDDDMISIMARDNGYTVHYHNITHVFSLEYLTSLQVFSQNRDSALSLTTNRALDRHICHSKLNKEYDLTMNIIILVVIVFIIVVAIVVIVRYVKHRKNKQLKKPTQSYQSMSPP